MTQKINIFSEKWCDMVFENKNKEYGAFFLRKITPKNHFVAIIIAFVFFTVAISAPVLFRKMAKKQVEKVLEVTTLSKLKTEEAAPPPPPKDETPVQKQTVAFKPPEVTTENVPDELPPTQEDMNAKPQQIAAVTNVDTLVNLKTTEKPKEIVEADTKVFEFV
ncbi:MAG: hypothetical protein Q8880_06615 [Bacteroidota bacterium]|nr:hypothetical protein [Bacteroidota bacterium]